MGPPGVEQLIQIVGLLAVETNVAFYHLKNNAAKAINKTGGSLSCMPGATGGHPQGITEQTHRASHTGITQKAPVMQIPRGL